VTPCSLAEQASSKENKLKGGWVGDKSLTSKSKEKSDAIVCLTYSSTLKKGVEDLSEMSVNFYELHDVTSQKTGFCHSHRRGNLKPHILPALW
jgi:hypothetical protein